MKIKVKLYDGQVLPTVIKQGDWIDIPTTSNVVVKGPIANTLRRRRTNTEDTSTRNVEFNPVQISLGFAMQLPKGFEAHVLPRSSTFKKFGIQLVNTQGIIDQLYRGNEDIWQAELLPFRDAAIPTGTRLFQFRIILSQKATIWQKLKWLFWNGKIKFVEVRDLGNSNRGGIGSTGI